MSTFWRTEMQRLVDEHRAAGHLVAGGPGLDPDHLDDWFWHVTEQANKEERAHGRGEFLAAVRETAQRHRQAEARRHVDGVIRRHHARQQLRHEVRVRAMKTRLREALREMDQVLPR